MPGAHVKNAFSLPEMLVVVAIIAVLAALAIPAISGMMSGSKTEIARRNLNLLNAAVNNYNQANREITNASGQSIQVVNLLKARDPNIPGSPFLAASANATVTSSTATYRAQWNGKYFSMIANGAAGSGIDLAALSGHTN